MQTVCLKQSVWAVVPLLAAWAAPMAAEILRGRVLDRSGAAVADAEVTLVFVASGLERKSSTAPDGGFQFENLTGGHYSLAAGSRGFSVRRILVKVPQADGLIEVRLQPATLAQEVQVTATQLIGTAESLERIPGAAALIPASTLLESRVITTEEALRKISGVHARGEDAFGLRPNIGIRGLNPTRSTRVLLLEDGVPLSYAPYGDNASYYHPPVDRFDGIEVVKGGGQILYGPMTVGGVVNYLTPAPPPRSSGAVTLIGGNRDYFNGHGRYGTTWKNTGFLLDYTRKQGEGSRENVRHGINDLTAKTLTSLGGSHTLGLKWNYYGEDSNLTYSGLREDEWLRAPRSNPFRNDFFYIDRYGSSATHTWALRHDLMLVTNAYGSVFRRDWWRQSSNSGQRPNDAADPLCGGMGNLNSTCGNEGRLRSYSTWGVEPKARFQFGHGTVRNESDFGVRIHLEAQERLQKNGDSPAARDGRVVENNQRTVNAYSTFFQHRFLWSKLTLTPGIRVEHVRYKRTNRLALGGAGVSGATELTQWIPGLGLAYSPGPRLTFFAGAHRGFAPPRVEDVINNNTGQSVELDPELSWNYEAGLRSQVTRNLRLEGTFFRLDFQNQIIPASVAGGIGATLTNAGETLHQGLEFAGRWDWRSVGQSRHNLSFRGAYTWLPDARFAGQRFSNVPGYAGVSITGNRLPYAMTNSFAGSLVYSHARGLSVMIENIYTGRQYSDDLNTLGGTPDGQRGLIPGNAIWNATVNYPIEPLRSTLFFSMKNLLDRLAIVDRSRGLLPGIPRMAQFGLHFQF